MGKDSILKTLGKRIGNVVLHKLLIKYTNRPESISHMNKEEFEYRNSAIKDSKKYNWNEEDRKQIKYVAFDFLVNKMNKKYLDVNFPLKEAEGLIEEEIINIKT